MKCPNKKINCNGEIGWSDDDMGIVEHDDSIEIEITCPECSVTFIHKIKHEDFEEF